MSYLVQFRISDDEQTKQEWATFLRMVALAEMSAGSTSEAQRNAMLGIIRKALNAGQSGNGYQVIQRLQDDAIYVKTGGYGCLVWTRLSHVRLGASCQCCGASIQPGDVAYRPMKPRAIRSQRICSECGDQ